MKYQFVTQHRDRYPVEKLCDLLGISRSGYYVWKSRKPSQREHGIEILIAHIRRIHAKYRKVYGSPRIHAALKKEGIHCNPKTVAKYMRQEGLSGQRKQRKVVTTNSKHDFPVAPNLLQRDFHADKL
jgi:putative transposase